MNGKIVAALALVRLGRCQWGSKPTPKQQRCTRKTRTAIVVPVIDNEDMVAVRLCGEHITAGVEALR